MSYLRRTDARVVFESMVTGLAPDPLVTVDQWAEEARFVAAEGSPHPGKWRTELVPYAAEIMHELSLSRPCREVILKKSAQVAGTEIGINAFGTIACRTPAAIMIVLPTDDDVFRYVRTKLEPTIEATPELREKVATQKSRDEKGSTTTMKKFPGGFCLLTGANSSSGLQMVSVRALLLEEVSEYPFDVDGRGDPVDLALKRTTAYTEMRKVFWNSTPALKGMCRISAKYDDSDQRRYFVPCPHCGVYQILKFERLEWRSDIKPHGAHFVCLAHGCVIEAHHKRRIVAAGWWLKTYAGQDSPGELVEPLDLEMHRARPSRGREPGFAIWQAYSPFVPWDDTVAEYLASRGNPIKEKAFSQQALGEPYEEKGDSPDYLKLFARREDWKLGQLPPGVLFLTGAADVQAGRIEWAVWGWGIGKSSWLVDKGVVEGDTSDLAVYQGLGEVLTRTYETPHGRRLGIEAFAIDTGYNTQTVYAWVRRQGPRVMAVDGRPGHLTAALGTPRTQEVTWKGERLKRGVLLWPVGTWSLKAEFYANLQKTIAGPDPFGNCAPGYVHFPADGVDEAYLQQCTAEYLETRETRNGVQVRAWMLPRGVRNEALDIRVYATAAAVHLGMERWTPADWLKIAGERGSAPEEAQMQLALWQGVLKRDAGAEAKSVALEQIARIGRPVPQRRRGIRGGVEA